MVPACRGDPKIVDVVALDDDVVHFREGQAVVADVMNIVVLHGSLSLRRNCAAIHQSRNWLPSTVIFFESITQSPMPAP